MKYIHFVHDAWYAKYDDDFVPENVIRLCDAIGAFWAATNPGAKVYIGYDTRRYADSFALLAAGSIEAAGLIPLVSSEACPMPAINYAVREDGEAIGAIMITADHRNSAYCGVRVRNTNGMRVNHEVTEAIENLISYEDVEKVEAKNCKVDFLSPFLDFLKSTVDVDLIKSAGIKCVSDSLYGSSRDFAPKLLRALGCDVKELHTEHSSDFSGIHPDAIEPWCDECEYLVKDIGADLGLVFDGAANRLALIDDSGSLVAAPKMHSLVLECLIKYHNISGSLLVPRSSSLVVQRVAKNFGCDVCVVGDTVPIEQYALDNESIALSSDGVAGLTIPEIDPARDAFICALFVLELMARKKKSVSELVEEIDEAVGPMQYLQRNVGIDVGLHQVLNNVLPGLSPDMMFDKEVSEVSHADGLYVRFVDDSWFLARLSVSEPLVRFYAEAPDKKDRDILIEKGMKLLGALQ